MAVHVMLHIHCGDCAAEKARQAVLPDADHVDHVDHVDHEILVWHDSPALGPCSIDFATHRQLRAQWWQHDPADMQSPAEVPRDRPLVLWFGPDPWEQLALVELLAGLPDAPISLVPLDRGVGETSPALLPARVERRYPAPPREPLRRLWADFCADERDALAAAVTELRGHPRLPHLAAALARVLADRRDQLTERRVRTLVAAGIHDLHDLMQRLRALEAPGHGAWYGDATVARLRDATVARLRDATVARLRDAALAAAS